jgi:4-hydroxyphenylacetate 3-monooxygenase
VPTIARAAGRPRNLHRGERVDDVTTHPGFRNAARSYAAIFDARFDERYRHILVSEEGGEPCATYFVRPRSRADLAGEPARAK